MTLHHGNNKGKYARLAAENRHDGLAVLPNMKFCKIVIALGVTRIDREVFYRITCLDNIAKWGKGLTGQQFTFQLNHEWLLFPEPAKQAKPRDAAIGKNVKPDMGDSSKLCHFLFKAVYRIHL